jgi:NTE family protein
MLAAITTGSSLSVSSATSASTACSQENAEELKTKSGFALALGGGAAKAFAHIPILEALDELGVKPSEISGTSMGAILGGFYASGMTGKEIRNFSVDLFTRKPQLLNKLFLKNGRTWSSLFNISQPAIIDPVVLFETIFPPTLANTFEDLNLPLKVMATDFYSQSEVVLESGPLLPAIAASSALPMLLTPVKIDGQVLIDGGFVNPTPFDVFEGKGRFTVGVDVTGSDFSRKELPSGLETWIGSFAITLHSLVAAKLECSKPDLLIEPPIGKFMTMDFFKIEEIIAAAEPAKDEFKRKLTSLLDAG